MVIHKITMKPEERYIQVSIDLPSADKYQVIVTTGWDTRWWITDATNRGFGINFSTPSMGGENLWFMIHRQG